MFNDIEYSMMAILANHPELVNITTLTPEMFENREYSKVFTILKKIKKFDPVKFLENGYTNLEMLVTIIDGLVLESTYEDNFRFYEKKMIDAYKTRELATINYKLQSSQLDYEGYDKRFKELSAIQCSNSETYNITAKEIDDCLIEGDAKITFASFSKLSRLLNLETNDLVTVAGTSGFGKSALLLNIAVDLLDQRYKVQYYNLEMSHKKMLQRMIAIMTKIPIKNLLSKTYSQEQGSFIQTSKNRLVNAKFMAYSGSATFERLKSLIVRNIEKGKQNVVFIDHVMLIGVENRNYNTSEYNRITYVMQELRKICLEYNVLIFIASQVDRTSAKENKITINSLKSSGEIENSSTHVILLYEDTSASQEMDVRNPIKNVYMDVGKNRNNSIARISAEFYPVNQKFYEK